MRGIGFLAVGAAILGGCAPEEKAAEAPANAVAAAPASPAPKAEAPAPPPEPAKVDNADNAIPAAFHGVFDSSLEACARPSDGRLTVSAGELRFHESIGIVRSVAAARSGAIGVEADYQGEGESWRSRRELLLSDDGARLTVSGDGTRMVRVRCPQGGL